MRPLENLSSPQADTASCSAQSARTGRSSARSRGWAASAGGCTQSVSGWCHTAACPSWTWDQLPWKQAEITWNSLQPSLFYKRDTNIMKQNVSSPDNVVVQEAGGGRGPGWRHQEPVINPSISNVIQRLSLCQSTWDLGAPQTSNCNEIAACSTLCRTHFETFWPTLMPPELCSLGELWLIGFELLLSINLCLRQQVRKYY